jgi:hypothetical protein
LVDAEILLKSREEMLLARERLHQAMEVISTGLNFLMESTT